MRHRPCGSRAHLADRSGQDPDAFDDRALAERCVAEDEALAALGGDPVRREFERDVLVHGSPQLAQTLIEHDLVDALHLLVYPIIVGAGKRLLERTSETKRLRLIESRTFGDGVHLLAYDRA